MLACDLSRLAEEAAAMERAGADLLHLDVMDGHFVPNLSLGVPVIASLRPHTGLLFDTHLMLTDPIDYIDAFVKAGSDRISIHLEASSPVGVTLEKIQASGVQAGLVLNPATPAQAAFPYLEQLAMVLVMTVQPGFGGQSFQEEMCAKISALRRQIDAQNLQVDIQVDGGIDLATAPRAVASGANVLVAGSSLFSQPDYVGAVAALRAAGEGAQG